MIRYSCLAALLLITATAPLFAQQSADELVKTRQRSFKNIERKLDAIADVLDSRSTAQTEAQQEIISAAEIVNQEVEALAKMFPAYSENGRRTDARPEIWTDNQRFQELMSGFQDKALALLNAAQNDYTTVPRAFEAIEKTCKNCHRSFRY